MKLESFNHDESSEKPSRRLFFRSAIVGGILSPLLLTNSALANESMTLDEELCRQIPASTLLALYSLLAFQLPNKLKKLGQTKDNETKLFEDFDTEFGELVELAKQLKLNCDANSVKDPRIDEIDELAAEAVGNVANIKISSDRERDLAFLSLTALAIASQQIARNANDLLPDEQLLRDQEKDIVCKMLAKVKKLEEIRVPLKEARAEFQSVFDDFFATIGQLNKTMLQASESAARAERGEIGKSESMVEIRKAKNILEQLARDSEGTEGDSINPDLFILLLTIPEDLLKGGSDNDSVTRKADSKSNFRRVSYDSSETVLLSQIGDILRRNIRPSDGLTMYFLGFACAEINRKFERSPMRQKVLFNTIRLWPLLNRSSSRITTAAAEINRL